jgi:hypothetical protein
MKGRISMDKKKFVFWGIVLLIGLMLTGCAGDYGAHGYSDYPYYNQDYGYSGSPYYHENHGGW